MPNKTSVALSNPVWTTSIVKLNKPLEYKMNMMILRNAKSQNASYELFYFKANDQLNIAN